MDHVNRQVNSRTALQKKKTLSKAIALFDFDGTITRKDTLIEIIKYQRGKFRFYTGLLILSPVLILHKLKILPAKYAKERVLQYFFKGVYLEEFQKKCDNFVREVLPGIIHPSAFACIQNHLKEGTKVVIVSASAENWLSAWCKQFQLDYIGTKLEIREGKLSGKIAGKNCNGMEKVNRIKSIYNLDNFAVIYAYGDSKGDLPMLKVSTKPYYRSFDK